MLEKEIFKGKPFWEAMPTNNNVRLMYELGYYLLEYNESQGWHYNAGMEEVNTYGWEPIGFIPQKYAGIFCDFVDSHVESGYLPIQRVKDFYSGFCQGIKFTFSIRV